MKKILIEAENVDNETVQNQCGNGLEEREQN